MIEKSAKYHRLSLDSKIERKIEQNGIKLIPSIRQLREWLMPTQ